MKISKRDATIMIKALQDAISDRMSFADAYRPRFIEPDTYARKMIKETERLVKKYKILRVKLVDLLNKDKCQ